MMIRLVNPKTASPSRVVLRAARLGLACLAAAALGCVHDEPIVSSEPPQTKFLRPEDYSAFPEREAPEALGQEPGGINLLPDGHPLLADFKLHGIRWPMVENAGSSRVYPPQEGICSYYWQDLKVATGEFFDPSGMTAAHLSLPFGTLVRCTRKDNGKSVVVMINDRGPYVQGRILDLSKGAAAVIGLHEDGITPVVIEVLAYPLIEAQGPKGNG